MALVDDYRADIRGLPVAEARALRALWYSTAKRYLNLHGITSDPVADFPEAVSEPASAPIQAKGLSPKDMDRILTDHRPSMPDHTRPVDSLPGLPRRFVNRDIQELVDLYRVTKPVKRPAQ